MTELAERMDEIESLLQNIIGYLAKMRDPRGELASELRKLNERVDLLIRRTESAMVSVERLIAMMEDFLRTQSRPQEVYAAGTAGVKSAPQVATPPDVTQQLRDELEEIKQQISDLQFQHRSGFIGDEEYRQQLQSLEERRKELRGKLTELGGSP